MRRRVLGSGRVNVTLAQRGYDDIPAYGAGMREEGAPGQSMLRRCALAVAVLHDVDLQPADDGVVLAGTPDLTVTWGECAEAVFDAPDDQEARHRLARWLRLRRALSALTSADLDGRVRPVGLPVAHVLHPGLSWVRERVLGNALDLGLGLLGVGDDPDLVEVVPTGVLNAVGVDAVPWWPGARSYLERMGAVAAERCLADPEPTLRPIGDCDVVTLLGSAVLRAALCGGNGGTMRAVAVPMRRRGWLDLRRIDPAFALAAAAATDPAERGFSRPLLVTADEVTAVAPGDRPAEEVLRDPAALRQAWDRPVRYRD